MSTTSAPTRPKRWTTRISRIRWPKRSKSEFERGIALCGSGEGMAITLNKHQRIRAGLVWRKEIAELVKKHNNANVIVLPARFITNDEAVEFIETYLTTEFEGGRHERRIAKIPVKGRE